jgi:hypothetical protein
MNSLLSKRRMGPWILILGIETLGFGLLYAITRTDFTLWLAVAGGVLAALISIVRIGKGLIRAEFSSGVSVAIGVGVLALVCVGLLVPAT